MQTCSSDETHGNLAGEPPDPQIQPSSPSQYPPTKISPFPLSLALSEPSHSAAAARFARVAGPTAKKHQGTLAGCAAKRRPPDSRLMQQATHAFCMHHRLLEKGTNGPKNPA